MMIPTLTDMMSKLKAISDHPYSSSSHLQITSPNGVKLKDIYEHSNLLHDEVTR